MRFFQLLLISVIWYFIIQCAVQAQPIDEISVGLIQRFGSISSIGIENKSGLTVGGLNSGNPIYEEITFRLKGNRIEASASSMEPVLLLPPIEIAPADNTITYLRRFGGKPYGYRGRFVLMVSKSSIRIINRLSVEDYLLGVLPAEMPASFHPEALKAQAVAARTYAIRAFGKHKSDGYDVCDSSNCQIYLGADGERPSCSKAVLETAGMVLRNESGLFLPLYSSDCGGKTRFFASDKTFIPSVVDAPENGEHYCGTGVYHKWTAKIAKQRLLPILFNTGKTKMTDIESVSLENIGDDERPKKIRCIQQDRSAAIDTDVLRSALGGFVLKSPWITNAYIEKDQVVFEGRGYGHGYGMCQIGANGMASPPHNKNFREILAHYYPGTFITGDQSAIEAIRTERKRTQSSFNPKKGKAVKNQLPPLILFEP